MSELRTEFERLHPVPEGIVWRHNSYMPEVGFIHVRHPDWKVAERHTDLWQGFQSGHAAGLEAQAKRIAELESSLADSDEALQILGLKLAQAEADVARVQAMHEGLMKNADQMNTELEAENTRLRNTQEMMGNKIGRWQERFDLLLRGVQSHSASAVVGPTPVTVTAPAWQSMDTAPTDGSEFLIRYPLQGNVKQLACWNNVHKYWQSKGEPITPMQQKCEWHPLP